MRKKLLIIICDVMRCRFFVISQMNKLLSTTFTLFLCINVTNAGLHLENPNSDINNGTEILVENSPTLQNNEHTTIGIEPDAELVIHSKNNLEAIEFNNYCLKINSSNDQQNDQSGRFAASCPVKFKNSQIVLFGNAQFKCEEGLTLTNCAIVIKTTGNYTPKFEIGNGLTIEKDCKIKIDNEQAVDLKKYIKHQDTVNPIFNIQKKPN